jgi:catechol 2,3-dioxygenase-like lactoylglutathione lyase family enzyme
MIKAHISLRVSCLERSVAFYEAFFGAPPHKLRPGYANFDLEEPPLKFALNEAPGVTGTGCLDHLGFQVGSIDAVHAFKARLQRAGLATFDEADVTCCYAKQDKVWAHDPDGNEWEVYVLTDDLLDDDSHDHAGNLLELDRQPSAAFRVVAPAHRCCEAGTGE